MDKIGSSLTEALTLSRSSVSAPDIRRPAKVLDFKLVAEHERVLQFVDTMKRREAAAIVEKFIYMKRRGHLILAIQVC